MSENPEDAPVESGVVKHHICKEMDDAYGFIDNTNDGDAEIEVFLATDGLGERDDSWCLKVSSDNYALVDGLNFCPFCGEQLNGDFVRHQPSMPLLENVNPLM